MNERVPTFPLPGESESETDRAGEEQHLIEKNQEIQEKSSGEAVLEESLKWIQRLQTDQFQRDNHERYKRVLRWERDGVVVGDEEPMTDQKTETLNEGLETLTAVVEQMKKAMGRGEATTEHLHKMRKKAEEYQRLDGKEYNKGVVLGTLTDWMENFQKEGSRPGDVDLKTIRSMSEDVETMMYKIHQYGDASQYDDDPGEFNARANSQTAVQEAIDACIKHKYQFKNK